MLYEQPTLLLSSHSHIWQNTPLSPTFKSARSCSRTLFSQSSFTPLSITCFSMMGLVILHRKTLADYIPAYSSISSFPDITYVDAIYQSTSQCIVFFLLQNIQQIYSYKLLLSFSLFFSILKFLLQLISYVQQLWKFLLLGLSHLFIPEMNRNRHNAQ